MIYDFNQRVYLRRDPSQYGRIGTTSPSGATYDWETRTQPVFWEHEGADIVTVEHVDDLMVEEDLHERRRLFFAAMRRPEMRVLLIALQHLHIDKDIDWRAIQSIDMSRYGSNNDCWMMITDKLLTYTLWADKPDLSIYDFSTLWLHNQDDPACRCDYCDEARRV